MTTTRQNDYLDRLTSISSVGGASSASPISFNYNYNPANQRVRSTLVDNSYWIYQYDTLGQVTSDKYPTTNAGPSTAWQSGRRPSRGDRTVEPAVSKLLGENLNHTQPDVPGYVDVKGVS